ncbi:hypothetical protein CLV35_2646 [Motilibacter peucedani]|uniref:DUF6542 domain-containing protein n=1 Tax=Motilibacter peucedani TaxID=598650 RepID=A0A420XMF7_9ACTN|nr:DUF6542 domain-containing protein [Motilibacter peucedani]RKS72402.1 hypothetical protein CLV35_2646 [Motilibacter peucedani]
MPVFPNRPGTGLPATGATLVLSVLCFAGALADIGVRGHLGTCFSVAYVAGCALLGARLVRRDLAAALIVPPLVFVTVAFVALQLITRGEGARSFLVNEVMGLGGALASGAPVLLLGLAVAAALAGFRVAVARAHRTPPRPAAGRALRPPAQRASEPTSRVARPVPAVDLTKHRPTEHRPTEHRPTEHRPTLSEQEPPVLSPEPAGRP